MGFGIWVRHVTSWVTKFDVASTIVHVMVVYVVRVEVVVKVAVVGVGHNDNRGTSSIKVL